MDYAGLCLFMIEHVPEARPYEVIISLPVYD